MDLVGDTQIEQPRIISVLKTTDPTTVDMPVSEVLLKKRPMIAAKSSGDEVPAAISVAPATSGGILKTSTTTLKEATKYSSHKCEMASII
mmetsp:Transcript_29457/g.53356  ORF Transcript_29457/g.53356 Transcript_29457/m.53356 type:complete len:90 (+) Transcript_29457:571-840(+)